MGGASSYQTCQLINEMHAAHIHPMGIEIPANNFACCGAGAAHHFGGVGAVSLCDDGLALTAPVPSDTFQHVEQISQNNILQTFLPSLIFQQFKGTVQRKLTGVFSGINR
jgi:hypothetical protein